MVHFYHFTSEHHLPKIVDAGFLKTVESNLSIRRTDAGPRVLWLTDLPLPAAQEVGLDGSSVDKTAVRFTLELPQDLVHPWTRWSRKRYITKRWAAVLEEGKARRIGSSLPDPYRQGNGSK